MEKRSGDHVVSSHIAKGMEKSSKVGKEISRKETSIPPSYRPEDQEVKMNTTKEEVIELVKAMPDNVTVDDYCCKKSIFPPSLVVDPGKAGMS